MTTTKRISVTALALAVVMLFSTLTAVAAPLDLFQSRKAKISCKDPDAVKTEAGLKFQKGDKLQSDAFTGNVYFKSMIPHDTTYNFPTTNLITFEPGARSSWHRHGGMLLLIIGGKGYYQEEGKPAQILRKGDIVQIPEGTRHWHGATADSWFEQIVIYDADYVPTVQDAGDQHVTDYAYKHLKQEEYTGRKTDGVQDTVFRHSEQAITDSPNFSGPVYVEPMVTSGNAANAPAMFNVVFKPGTYNNWHHHDGGQILICTDGIGYHQLKGGKVEVLHPGDVAFCPPGETHWHGGSNTGTFAHIAIETNPDLPGVKWSNERLSRAEYNALPKV